MGGRERNLKKKKKEKKSKEIKNTQKHGWVLFQIRL